MESSKNSEEDKGLMVKEEKKITIEIFYSDNGLQYEDYSYETDDKLEQRDVAFLVACFLKHFILDED